MAGHIYTRSIAREDDRRLPRLDVYGKCANTQDGNDRNCCLVNFLSSATASARLTFWSFTLKPVEAKQITLLPYPF